MRLAGLRIPLHQSELGCSWVYLDPAMRLAGLRIPLHRLGAGWWVYLDPAMGLAGLRIPLHQLGWGRDRPWPLPPSPGVGALMVPFNMSLQVFPWEIPRSYLGPRLGSLWCFCCLITLSLSPGGLSRCRWTSLLFHKFWEPMDGACIHSPPEKEVFMTNKHNKECIS